MAKGNKKLTKSERKEEVERKRDERCRRNALRKERKIKEYLEHDENFVSFSNQLQALGLKIKDVLGDGWGLTAVRKARNSVLRRNCLFRALGDQLEGDHTSHGRHRRETVRYMREHQDDFEPFVEDEVPFEKYLKELSQLGTYGGNDSIVAFARNNGVDITIHQLNEPRWIISGSQYSRRGKVDLHLSYHNGDHYSSVRTVNDPDDGPAWPHHQQNQHLAETRTSACTESLNKKGKAKQKLKQKYSATEEFAKSEGAFGQTTSNTYDHNHDSSFVGTCGQNSYSCNYGQDLLDAEQAVMTATGCKDLVVVAQSLAENNYNVDATIGYILQLMCVAEVQDFVCENKLMSDADGQADSKSSSLTNNTKTPELDSDETNESSTDVSIETEFASSENINDTVGKNLVFNDSKTCSNVNPLQGKEQACETQEQKLGVEKPLKDSTQSSKDAVPKNRGARPRTRPGHRQPNLSNKKRKELAKQEKKKRRMEEKKGNATKLKTNQSVVAENSFNTVVPDLGSLAI